MWLRILPGLAALLMFGCPAKPTKCETDRQCQVTGQDEWEACTLAPKTSAWSSAAHADAWGRYQDWNDCRCIDRTCAFTPNTTERDAVIAFMKKKTRAKYEWCSDAKQTAHTNRFQEGGVLTKVIGSSRCSDPIHGVVQCSFTLVADGAGWKESVPMNCQ